MFTPVCNTNMYSLVVLRYMYSCILVFSAVLFVLCIRCNVVIQHYLAQRLSVAIQRGNSASVMGTMDGDGEEFFV